MPATQPQVISAAFDGMAASYDQTFTSSIIGRAQRAPVWNELTKAFRPGDRVLEIGCGTGVDACYLAERGVRVLACDPSPQMVNVAAARVGRRGLHALVHTHVLGAEDIFSLPTDQPFDGVFSNFGAFNCVDDLRLVAEGIAKVLRPGGMALLCWMGPLCLWETFFYLAQGNTRKAFRRFRRDGVFTKLAEKAFVQVHYPSVTALTKNFTPEFRLKSVQGIGVAVPPSYLESWARSHPRSIDFCERLDSLFSRCPVIRSIGDHVLVRLERRQSVGEE